MSMRILSQYVLTSMTLLAIAFSVACGGASSGSSGSPPAAPITGEWALGFYNFNINFSGAANGYLTASGNTVTGVMFLSGNGCASGQRSVSGTINGSTITLTGLGMTVTGQLSPDASTITGSFTGCSNGSAGGNKIPPLTGAWSGTFSINSTGSIVDATATITQASTPDLSGSESLSGSLMFTGSNCFTSGTLAPSSYVRGGTGEMIVNLSDGGLLTWSPLGLSFDRSSVNGSYSIAGGACHGQSGGAVLTPKA